MNGGCICSQNWARFPQISQTSSTNIQFQRNGLLSKCHITIAGNLEKVALLCEGEKVLFNWVPWRQSTILSVKVRNMCSACCGWVDKLITTQFIWSFLMMFIWSSQSIGLFIYSAKTCLRQKTPPRLGHLPTASEVAGSEDIHYHYKKGMAGLPILKWYDKSSCYL
jgi:hypothetical protein